MKIARRLFALCLCAAALVIATLVVATTTPPTNFNIYIPSNDTGTPYLSQQEAVDAYFAKLEKTGLPTTNSRCWRYYWNLGPSGPYTDAKWIDGALVKGCADNRSYDNFQGIATASSCPSLDVERCSIPYSPAQPKNAGPTDSGDNKPKGGCNCGNPINIGTGNKYQVEEDFTVPGSPWLNFTRYYNSQANRAKGFAMGTRWKHSFDYRLVVAAGGAVALERPDGAIRSYGGSAGTDPDRLGYIDYIVDANSAVTGYTFNDEEGRIETYAKNGTLTKIEFREGGFVTLTHNSLGTRLLQVTDHFGRNIAFSYDNSNRVTSVTAPNSAVYSYTYDSYDRLLTRTAPGSQPRTYGYDVRSSNPTKYQMGILTSITDETGVVIGKYTYDTTGRAISTEGAGGADKFAVSYGTGTNTVTSVLGSVTQMTFDTVLGVPRQTATTTTCTGGTCNPVGATAATYDANGNLTSKIESDGSKSCMAYDLSRKLMTRVVAGLASGSDCAAALSGGVAAPATMTSIQWHTTMRLPVGIAGPKQIQTLDYDAAGRVIAKTVAATTDDTGNQGFSAQAAGASRVDTYAYNAAGQLVSHTGPSGGVADVTTYAYGSAGVLVSSTNALGQVTGYSQHDGSGRPGTITQPSGAQIQIGYTLRGFVSAITNAGLTTNYTYYANGRLASVTAPSGESLSYTYDGAGRITRVTDQRGNYKSIGYNLAGGATSEQTKTSAGAMVLDTARVFDALNRVTKLSGAHRVEPQPESYVP